MRVLLVSSNTERINMVTLPLGLAIVAASTRRAGHEVSYLDLLGEPDPVEAVQGAIAAAAPEAIGISVRNVDDQERAAPRFLLAQVRPVVAACRAATHAPVVLGGAGFSIFPESALLFLGADYGVRGDGEAAFPALLSALEAGTDPGVIPGVVVAGRGAALPADLSREPGALPAWDEALGPGALATGPDVWVPVQSRSGCPNDCSYCSTALIQGRRLRTRPVAEVVAHVAGLAASGARRLFFVDNSFNVPEPYALDLCNALAALGAGLEWRCIVYPQRLGEDLVRAMAAAGCVEASLGFESGSPRVLRELNKHFGPDDVRAVSALLRAHGIRRRGFLLLGGPGETRETVEESLALAADLELDALRATVGIRIYPGTPLALRAVAEGVVAPGDDLLTPRFYLAPGLEPWVHERVACFASGSGSPPPA